MALPAIPTGWIHTWLAPLYTWLLTVRAAIGAFLGTSWEPVRVITQGALPSNSYNSGTKRKTASANGALTIDSLAMRQGDRFWDNSAGTGSQRGLFVVEHPGSASSAWTAVRATDADASGEFTQGKSFVVLEGTAAGRVYQLTNSSFTLDTTTPAIGQDTLMRLGAVQTVTGRKDFAASTLAVDNDSTTNAHLLASSATAARTATLPDASITIAGINLAQTWSAIQRFAAGMFKIDNAGGTFSTLFATNATAARTATLPDKSGTIAFTDDVQTTITAGAASLSNNTFYLGAPGAGTSTSSVVLGVGGPTMTTKAQLDVWCATAAGALQTCVFTVQKSSDDGATWNNTSATVSFGASDTAKHSGEVAVDVDYGELVRLKAVASATAATAGVFANIRLYN